MHQFNCLPELSPWLGPFVETGDRGADAMLGQVVNAQGLGGCSYLLPDDLWVTDE